MEAGNAKASVRVRSPVQNRDWRHGSRLLLPLAQALQLTTCPLQRRTDRTYGAGLGLVSQTFHLPSIFPLELGLHSYGPQVNVSLSQFCKL